MLGTFELWLTTDTGRRLSQLSTGLGFQASKVVNGIGWFHYNPPKSFDRTLIRSDRMFQVWYTPRGATLGKLWNVYFLRKWKYKGKQVESFGGPDINEILRRRIIAAKTGDPDMVTIGTNIQADAMIFALVDSSTADSSTITSDYGTRDWSNFAVTTSSADGPLVTQSFQVGDRLLTFEGGGILPQIAKKAQVAGTEVFYWVVPYAVTKDSLTLTFRTWINQPGQDMTNKVIFEEAANNLANTELEYDYSDEVNYIYATGQGEGADREVQQVYDTARIGQSVWGRIEGEADSRNQSTPDAVYGSGQTALWEGRPKIRFTGTPLDTKGTPFGTAWDVGYKVTTKFETIQFDSIIRAVTLAMDSNGKKSIDARLDFEG